MKRWDHGALRARVPRDFFGAAAPFFSGAIRAARSASDLRRATSSFPRLSSAGFNLEPGSLESMNSRRNN